MAQNSVFTLKIHFKCINNLFRTRKLYFLPPVTHNDVITDFFWTRKRKRTPLNETFMFVYFGNQTDSFLNEAEEDIRAWFLCPFCYVEIEVPMLCSHLQEEHCFDLKNAVCPICAATLGKDPTGHFSVQHAHLVKRRRNYLKPGFWNNATAMIGKDPREIASFFGTDSVFGRYKVQESAPDPLLLPFLCNFAPSDLKCRQQDKSSVCDTAIPEIESSKLAVSDPELEEDFEEKRQRATFLQELVASTIF